ncbi:putative integral membrane protein, Mpv17/PMP22 family [Aspergillus steynii IBT 23096]|uniref:Putative integral membrane protein, Mpv17/PMP22 family n=1 Tax=Aspergillus steynii IBT 23096 TaxID=1392250 RepID=A0A2I2G940_9EURO|nr:putative integral membrane protein, Mpv17/PMP22 family [Aspergillus steynii IBT 23096]PLB49394.1 putative integral membrane protein, Mpv17/PMP22 family [Aspergillus steynii IBT 23096]
MALPAVVKASLQSTLINAGSNILAQGIQAHQNQRPFELDRQALWLFTTCAFLMSPLTFLWLEGLESALPGSYEEKSAPKSKTEKGKDQKPRSRLNVKNIAAKVVIDQTIGGAYNTFLLIALMGYLRGEDYGTIMEQVNNEFWPLLFAGMKLWTFVSILNFTVVPTDKRMLSGSLFSVVWAIYLSLRSG